MNTKKSFNNEELKKIHSRFRKLRLDTETNEKKPISQRALAQKIGVVYTRINKLESEDDETEPSLFDLTAYSKYFNVSVDYLLGFADETTKNVEIKEITKKYGLSSKSLTNLQKIIEPCLKDTLNELLENDFLKNVLTSITDYIDIIPKFNDERFDEVKIDKDIYFWIYANDVEILREQEVLKSIKILKSSTNQYKKTLNRYILEVNNKIENLKLNYKNNEFENDKHYIYLKYELEYYETLKRNIPTKLLLGKFEELAEAMEE